MGKLGIIVNQSIRKFGSYTFADGLSETQYLMYKVLNLFFFSE